MARIRMYENYIYCKDLDRQIYNSMFRPFLSLLYLLICLLKVSVVSLKTSTNFINSLCWIGIHQHNRFLGCFSFSFHICKIWVRNHLHVIDYRDENDSSEILYYQRHSSILLLREYHTHTKSYSQFPCFLWQKSRNVFASVQFNILITFMNLRICLFYNVLGY